MTEDEPSITVKEWKGYALAELQTIDIEINHVMIAHHLDMDLGDALKVVELFSDEIYDAVMDAMPEIIVRVLCEHQNEREEQVRAIRNGFKIVKG